MPQSITQSQLLPYLFAIAAFLVAAVLILYIFRLVFGRRIRTNGPRNRPRRLDVVDAFELDRERQLVIVRRDNTEHLLLIGGPNDLLVESGINRGEASIPRADTRETRLEARPAAPGWPAAPGPAAPEQAAPRPAEPAPQPIKHEFPPQRPQPPREPPPRPKEPPQAKEPPRPQEPQRPQAPPRIPEAARTQEPRREEEPRRAPPSPPAAPAPQPPSPLPPNLFNTPQPRPQAPASATTTETEVIVML